MITIITGTPGNGKTAHALDLLYFQKGNMWDGLDLFVDGISDLKLPHFEFPLLSELRASSYVPLAQVDSDEYKLWDSSHPQYNDFKIALATAKHPFELWFMWATPNSVVFIDEAQRLMRPRPAGSPVPLFIQFLEYHRHFGLHMIFVTQKERLLHSNVRMLTGQHIHLTDGWRGRHKFVWPECKDSDSKVEKASSAHASYKLPVHVFPFYKSTVAVLTTKHKKPLYAYAFLGLLVVLPVCAFLLFKILGEKYHAPAAPVSSSLAAASGVPSIAPASGVVVYGVAGSAPEDFEAQFKPVVPSRPETAPAYDSLRRVVVMPQIKACIQSATDCRCYSQQGSRLPEVDAAACVLHIEQGRPFNPYAQPVEMPLQPPASAFNGRSMSQADNLSALDSRGLLAVSGGVWRGA